MKNLFLTGLLYLLLFSFSACEDDEVANDDDDKTEENQPPVADAGDDLEGSTGSTVTLDASGSTDPDEDELTYEWDITTKPETSNSTITNKESKTASFIPDAAGTYTIELTVNDGELTDTDEVLVTVEGEPLETVMVTEDINEETTWSNIFSDPTVPDYVVENNIKVNSTLSIEPGVVVHLKEEVIMTIETDGGALVAEGEEENRIIFTSANEEGEVLWGGLLINSSSTENTLNNVDIVFAGGTELVYADGWRMAGIGVAEEGKIGITNSTISKSGGDGVFVVRKGELTAFENNTFSQNSDFPLSLSINQVGALNATNTFNDDEETAERENVIRIYDSILEDDQEWSDLGGDVSYRFVGDASVEAKLTINEGVDLEFDEGSRVKVTSDGTLIAKGTEENPVVMTSSDISGGKKWAGILIESSTVQNELDHVAVLHAGGEQDLVYYDGWKAASIGLGNEAKLKLTNSEIAHSDGFGLVVPVNGELPAFAGNNFHDNASYPILLSANMAGMVDAGTVLENNNANVVAIYNSALTEDAAFNDPASPQWEALNGEARYLLLGKLSVEDDLVLGEGVHLALDDKVVVNVTEDGSFKAVGTPDKKITLTAFEQDGNHNWGGIVFNSANTNNQIKNAEISYGGNENALVYINGWKKSIIGVSNDASLNISSASISNSKGHGIAIHPESDVTLGTDVTFSNNELEDVLEIE